MSVHTPRRETTIETISRVEFEARRAAEFAQFNRNKSALLNTLREAHESSIKSEPFDANKSRHDLTQFAETYFRFKKMEWPMPAAERAKRLRKLADALSEVRALLKEALQGDEGTHLCRAWCPEGNITPPNVFRAASELPTCLNKLESAVGRAIKDARVKKGRPTGRSKLPSLETIVGLARVYRGSTGLMVTADDGLFAKFARKCFIALDGRDIKLTSLVSRIKQARHLAKRRYSAEQYDKLSPFT
jgi:hypothetical protein